MTKTLKLWTNITGILSFLLTVGVPLGYAISAFINTAHMQESNRLVVGVMFGVSIIIAVLNILMKTKMRSLVWTLLMISYIAFDKIGLLIILMCVTSLLDELIVTPIHKRLKARYLINKELDAREQN